MSATVILQVVSGPLSGAEFVYNSPAVLSVGRSHDCGLRLPTDFNSRTVSRHHCLLEVSPPEAWVCDLGSLNGTFVNDEPIGCRTPGKGADPMAVPSMPDHPLRDGDELRVGDVIFRVQVKVKDDGTEGAPSESEYQEVG
jgi:pSer/pThr/pTyr-binding forkhead associated (FHA) protein